MSQDTGTTTYTLQNRFNSPITIFLVVSLAFSRLRSTIASIICCCIDVVFPPQTSTQADAGIAIGAGTDVAVEAGDVVLTQNDPQDIVRLIKLSKKVYVKMIQNLVWALGYNVIASPAAAGAFAMWGFFLRPEIGALVMSLSTVIVVVNAMTLKRIEL